MKSRNFAGNVPGYPVLRRTTLALIAFALLAPLAPGTSAAEPADWFQWRGPEGSGVSREKNLPISWSPKGENVLWKNADYGTRCTPVAMNGKLYVVTRYKPETTEEGERLICIDGETGDLLWERAHNVFLSDAPAERVGWASPVADPESGNIFWLGLGCAFECVDGETGEVLWHHSMSEEYGMLSTYGGRTNFPIVFEDLVIVSGVMTQWGENAVPAHRYVGFDKRTGAAVWFSSTTPKPKDTTYSTPFLTTFDGQAALVFGAGDGKVHAMQPRTGKLIWSYKPSNRGIFTSPIVVDNIVYGGFHEQSTTDTRIRGGIFAFDGRTEGEISEEDLLWKIPGSEIEKGQPLVIDGRLYVVDLFGKLMVVDAKTGEIIQEKKVGRRPATLLFADNRIYCTEATGMYWVFERTEEGVEELERIRLNKEELLAGPIISNGKIYVTTSEHIYCIGKKDVVPEADAMPELPGETPKSEDQEIAHIQVAPVEAILAPGQTTPYQVRAYNKLGQFLKVVDAEFSVEGGGEISADGTYVAPETQEHTPIFVTAKVGDVSSTARARIIPPLPWSFDFNDKQVPVTWIGAAYRQQPKDVDGESVLVKVNTIPLGTRSQSWMGWTTLSDYTVQADLNSTIQESTGERADMGVINQRYTLDLMGKNELQIRSWTSRLENRFAKTIPFEWDENTWYTMKFQSENHDGKTTLRGKVWKRGTEEPADWSIEATDDVPNTTGSPGLFGNAQITSFYIDNVKVYDNK
ncbi:outer membrane protein assembly factor BamB family protein [Aureliella helgolandensis]|uniref:Outer membrane biogenesis protein BamB n=1 Tax=Aureliella helgolandensis TaxID=2527968 RepID=A0A518G0J7_9BACT|nr:PQQ-binding-like beta-propeller repeat protein [Aureliella helgolandensis]QDV22125.1 outer membrane biogenesis protein BamB [Aureliella helgolandensis]